MTKLARFRDAGPTRLRHVSPIILAISVITAIIGFQRSHVLQQELWQPTLALQALGLFALVGGIAGFCCIWSVRRRMRLEPLLLCAAIAIAIMLCGVASTGVVLIFLLSSLCIAVLFLTLFGVLPAKFPTTIIVAVGWALYIAIFSVLAPIPVNTTVTYAVILTAPIIAAYSWPPNRRIVRRSLAQVFDFRELAERPSTTYMVGLVACIIILSLHLAMVALPDRYYDALASHLYIASYVSAHRAWNFDAANYAFAYTPIGADMLYALMFLLQGETAARLLNFAAFLFTGAAVFQVANKNGSREAAIWTVVLFVSIPMMLIESATLFVEHTVTLFVMTAVAVLVLSKFRGNVVTHLMIMLLLAGATMVKLHGALAALLIAPVAIAACFRENISAEVAKRIFVLTGLVAVVAVWPYLYSWVHTGNPVFPLFNNIFKSPYFASVEFVDSRWIGKLSIFLPYRMTFASSDYVEAYDGAIGFSLLIFFAAGFAAAVIDRNSIALFCGGLACLLIILLVFKTQYLRYLVILFPLLMVAVGFGLDRMARLNYLRKPLAALVGVVTLLNVYKMPAGGWILGVSDLRACCDESYRRQLELDQAPERVVNRIINEIAGVNSRVFYVGNPFGALLSGTAIYSNWYNTRFSSALGMISSGPEFASLIERIAPTYIVIDTSSPGRLEALATEYAKQKGALVSQVGRLALYHL